MIDTLKEILSATYSLGFFELVKVTGTPDLTELTAMTTDRTVFMSSKFLAPVSEFTGIFGLHDLGRLNTILNIPEYKEKAIITISRMLSNGEEVLSGISFSNATKDFRNDYRFMSKEIIELQLPSRTRKSITWDVSVVPAASAIQRLKFQAQAAGSTINDFQFSTVNNELLITLGERSSHTGEFVFSTDIKGRLKNPSKWPLSKVQSILSLTGNKVLDINDNGAMQITVTTGLAVHQYTVLASI